MISDITSTVTSSCPSVTAVPGRPALERVVGHHPRAGEAGPEQHARHERVDQERAIVDLVGVGGMTRPGKRGGNEGCVPRPDVPPPVGGAGDRGPAGENQRVEVAQRMLGEVGVPCLLYTSPSPRDGLLSRMPSSA